MGDDRDFDASSPLQDVIAALLKLALPAERHELVPQLAGLVAGYPGVVEHSGKLWGEMSQSEQDRTAHMVGVIAQEVLGTARASDARKRFHDPTPAP